MRHGIRKGPIRDFAIRNVQRDAIQRIFPRFSGVSRLLWQAERRRDCMLCYAVIPVVIPESDRDCDCIVRV